MVSFRAVGQFCSPSESCIDVCRILASSWDDSRILRIRIGTATLAAVGFAGLLVFILRSDEVRGFLLNLIRTALALP